jgi:hypothetical protein
LKQNAVNFRSSKQWNHIPMAFVTLKLALALGAAYLSKIYSADFVASNCWAKLVGHTWIVGRILPKAEHYEIIEPIIVGINENTGAVIGATLTGEAMLCEILAHRVSQALTSRRIDLGSAFYRISWAQMIGRSKSTSPNTKATVLTIIESLGDKWQISRDGTAHCGKRWIRLSRPDRRIILKLAAL